MNIWKYVRNLINNSDSSEKDKDYQDNNRTDDTDEQNGSHEEQDDSSKSGDTQAENSLQKSDESSEVEEKDNSDGEDNSKNEDSHHENDQEVQDDDKQEDEESSESKEHDSLDDDKDSSSDKDSNHENNQSEGTDTDDLENQDSSESDKEDSPSSENEDDKQESSKPEDTELNEQDKTDDKDSSSDRDSNSENNQSEGTDTDDLEKKDSPETDKEDSPSSENEDDKQESSKPEDTELNEQDKTDDKDSSSDKESNHENNQSEGTDTDDLEKQDSSESDLEDSPSSENEDDKQESSKPEDTELNEQDKSDDKDSASDKESNSENNQSEGTDTDDLENQDSSDSDLEDDKQDELVSEIIQEDSLEEEHDPSEQEQNVDSDEYLDKIKDLRDRLLEYALKKEEEEKRKRELEKSHLDTTGDEIFESAEEEYELSEHSNRFLDSLKELPSFKDRSRGPGYGINTEGYTEVSDSIIRTLITKFLNRRFCKKNTDLNVRSNSLEKARGFYRWEVKDVITHLETHQVTKVLNDKYGYEYANGRGENVPLSFYFDMSVSMSEYTNLLAVIAIELLKKNVKVLIGFNEKVNVQIDSIKDNVDVAELARLLETAGYSYYNSSSAKATLSKNGLFKFKFINENLDNYLINKKAEKCVVFSDFDPFTEVCNLSNFAEVYWFCFEDEFSRDDADLFHGFIYPVQDEDDIASGLIKVNDNRFEALCFTENPKEFIKGKE